MREKIVDALPLSLRNAIGAGIGLFIAFIGLQNAGIIVNNDATLISLGDITSGSALLGIIGLLVTSILLVKKVRGALLIGILLTTVIGIPMGLTHLDGVLSTPPSIEPIFFQFQWEHIFTKEMVIVVFTFLFVDMFDTIGTLVGVTTKAGMVTKDGKIPHLKQAFLVDAIGTTAGAMLGTSTITTFVESASGVGEGGRSGLTSFVTAVCFLLSLFWLRSFGSTGCGYRSCIDSGRSDDDVFCEESRFYGLFRSYPGVYLHHFHASGLQHFRWNRVGNDQLRLD